MRILQEILSNLKGATAVEYGLIAALIAVAAAGTMTTVGGKLKNSFSNTSNRL
jgi:pilus assembly protein Flp/PilA